MRTRTPRSLLAATLAFGLFAGACSDDEPSSGSTTATTTDADGAGAGEPTAALPVSSGETLKLGYSAWPGWFPLAVAEEAGIFDEVGLDVELTYFADYIASIDAMAVGELDGVTQTLNDTMASVAFGDDQVIVVVNDNSTGNDKIICDGSITSIEDLEGKTIAAEAGVVDHFLLLQGLETVGLTEDDINFVNVLTDAAAAGFADGEFDCVGVFAPFWLTAQQREGSAELFSSADFPGTIPDHIVVSQELIDTRPEDVQLLVTAWYKTLAYMEEYPDESRAIMAAAAEISVEEYQDLEVGTTLFSAADALEAFTPGDTTASLQFTAELINPFLVESEFVEAEAPLDGLFDPSFTQTYYDEFEAESEGGLEGE